MRYGDAVPAQKPCSANICDTRLQYEGFNNTFLTTELPTKFLKNHLTWHQSQGVATDF